MMIISHSSIIPPYSSSTDAANYILTQIGTKRVNSTSNEYYVYKNRYNSIIQPKTRADLNNFHVEGYFGGESKNHIEQIDHLGNFYNYYIARRWNC
jgi:hypothetical protein